MQIDYNPKDFDANYLEEVVHIHSSEKPFNVFHESGICNVTAIKGGVIRRHSGHTNILVKNPKLAIKFANRGIARIEGLVHAKFNDEGLAVHEAFRGKATEYLEISQHKGDINIIFQ